MNRKTLSLSLSLFPVLAFFVLLLSAQLAFAQTPPCTPTPETVNGVQVQKYNCEFKNPITSQESDPNLGKLIKSIVTQLQPFAIAVATMAIIYAGFQYVLAAGIGQGQLTQQAKKRILYALYAAAIFAIGPVLMNAIIIFAEKIK
ncbi:MAG: hypothetical protein Q8R30_02250 [bacterium]|nr:hypothetical protein [bacterium]